MKIAALDIRACRTSAEAIRGAALKEETSERDGLDFMVYTLKTECGREATMFGFAGRTALGTGHHAAASLRPFIVGRDALDREGAWHAFRKADRWWLHLSRDFVR